MNATEGQVILITGATDGLGRALAARLAEDGAKLLLHGRDEGKLAEVAAEVTAKGAPAPATFVADLAELAQVRRLAKEVLAGTDRLDVFVSNAGIGFGEPDGRTRRTSVDGHELRFAVNYLAGFRLTLDLLPLLRDSRPSRVVNVASVGQFPLDFSDLMLERGYLGVHAYRRSKLAQIMSATEFAARIPADEVTFNSLHPASFMPTKIVVGDGITAIDTIRDGVAATHHVVTAAGLAGVTGEFFDRTRRSRAIEQAYDPRARAELWRCSLDLVGHEGIGEPRG